MINKYKSPAHHGRMASTIVVGDTLGELDVNLYNFLQTLENLHSVETHHAVIDNKCTFYAVVVYRSVSDRSFKPDNTHYTEFLKPV